MSEPLELRAWGSPVSGAAILWCLMPSFRVRCSEQQARLLSHYRLLDPHQILLDSAVPSDEVWVESLEGEVYGKVTGLYVPD